MSMPPLKHSQTINLNPDFQCEMIQIFFLKNPLYMQIIIFFYFEAAVSQRLILTEPLSNDLITTYMSYQRIRSGPAVAKVDYISPLCSLVVQLGDYSLLCFTRKSPNKVQINYRINTISWWGNTSKSDWSPRIINKGSFQNTQEVIL